MPRITPEIRTAQLQCWDRSSLNPTGTRTNFNITTYDRRYTGGERTPGYPRKQLYHDHSVVKRKVHVLGSTTLRRTYTDSNVWSQTDDGTWGPICNLGTAPVTQAGYYVDYVDHIDGTTQEAVNRAMDAVKDAKFNFAQFVAERAQVASMVALTANKLATCLGCLRRRNFPGAFEALGLQFSSSHRFKKDLADNWLSLQYGWKPLLSDVKSAAEHLAETHLNRPYHIRVRKAVKRSTNPQEVTSPWDIYGDAGYRRWKWFTRTTESKCELKFIVTNEYLREGTKLGITDPLLLAWELLPYSFVVDWFLPIGDFISKLTYDSGLTYVGGCSVTTSTQWVACGPVVGTKQVGTRINELSGWPTLIENVRFDRKIYTSPPRAVFPSLKDPFSATHVANALALLRGSFRPR